MFAIESNSPFENIVCDIASKKEIQTRAFYNMIEKSISDFTKRNKSEVTLYCRKYDPEFAHQDQYTMKSDDLPLLVFLDNYLCVKAEIWKGDKAILIYIYFFINIKLTNIFRTFYF